MIAMVTATFLSKGSLACSACSCNSSSTDIQTKYHGLLIAAGRDEVFHQHVRLFPYGQGSRGFYIFEEEIRYLSEVVFVAHTIFLRDHDASLAPVTLDGNSRIRILHGAGPAFQCREDRGI